MPVESRNPANDDSLLGTFNVVLRKFLQVTDDMLPARVISYDRALNRATVQPLIQLIDTDGIRHNRAQNTNLPVLLLGGGGFLVSFHLPPDSLGWIKANDRDTSLFLQQATSATAPPNTTRMHSFEDAIFIPDVILTNYTIDAEDNQAMVIQNEAGTVRLSLNESRIKLTAPAVEIAGPVEITGDVETTGTLMNNGVNVGSTHDHRYLPGPPGTAPVDTGPPQ